MPKKRKAYQPVNPEIAGYSRRHGDDPQAVLEIFQELQAQNGSLTPGTIQEVARSLKMPASRAFGVASFYAMLEIGSLAASQKPPGTVRVCDGPVCWLHGGGKIRQEIEELVKGNPGWKVERTSCLGLCDRAPAALVDEQQAGPLAADDLSKIFSGWRGQVTDYSQPRPGELRVMMAQAGKVDPWSIQSALEQGGYQGLRAALNCEPSSVVDEVEASGLNGRGGAGFPVGRKWRFVAGAERFPKYVICNADESEPLIFKDRVLIETNPHQVLEGMAIAGYATGADQAFIYIRGEYASQAELLEQAIQQAEEAGWLGDHIQGSDFSFHIHLHRGAGAYICGEETALIESLEGKRGEPRLRPPYPPVAGYHGLPTLVNNVESFAAVASITKNGAEWYRHLSGASTPGTKMYMLLGHVNRPGLFEAPFGLTLRQLIEDFGAGMRAGSTFHFVLAGGAAGSIVPAELLDIPIDYSSAVKGVSLGAGAFLVCDQTISPVAFLREILHFFTSESCGKCTPCREGTYRSLEILNRLVDGQGQPGDVGDLAHLASTMQVASFCGLGQSVAIPVKSALANFGEAFKAAEKE